MVGPPHGKNSFGTPVVNPRIRTDDYQLVPLFAALKPFEPELEKLQQEEQSRRSSASSNGAEKDGDGSGPARMGRNKNMKMEVSSFPHHMFSNRSFLILQTGCVK